ncbi:MAG: hypothetical protein AAF587_29280 [Bacteroidota bacterium]
MRTFILPAFICVLVMFSCKSQQYTPDSYEQRQIVFGGGGGFTGAVDTYCLLDNGQLFHKADLNVPFEKMKKVPKKSVKALFDYIDEHELNKLSFSRPGNMYSFVDIKENNKGQHVVWDQSNTEKVPAELISLHKRLMNVVKGAATK